MNVDRTRDLHTINLTHSKPNYPRFVLLCKITNINHHNKNTNDSSHNVFVQQKKNIKQKQNEVITKLLITKYTDCGVFYSYVFFIQQCSNPYNKTLFPHKVARSSLFRLRLKHVGSSHIPTKHHLVHRHYSETKQALYCDHKPPLCLISNHRIRFCTHIGSKCRMCMVLVSHTYLQNKPQMPSI